MENFVIFMTIWNILRPYGIGNLWHFGIVCVNLVYFYVLVCFDREKSGNPSREMYSRLGRPQVLLKWQHLHPQRSFAE
jgi:hypothetical protein